jgi:hypothetical protein
MERAAAAAMRSTAHLILRGCRGQHQFMRVD